jgi:hypothetical protein
VSWALSQVGRVSVRQSDNYSRATSTNIDLEALHRWKKGKMYEHSLSRR